MIRIAAALGALAALGAYEAHIVALLGLSLSPWALATLIAGVVVLIFFFMPTPRLMWTLALVGVIGASFPVLGASGQIFSSHWTGQEFRGGRWVPMGPPSLSEHFVASIKMFATLLTLCLVSLVLWKRVVFGISGAGKPRGGTPPFSERR